MSQWNRLVPSGPPAPTGKTLAEIRPATPINQTTAPGTDAYVHRIVANQAGAYYLTSDIIVSTGMGGIEIQFKANDSQVTLDLNGFAIRGGEGTRTGILLMGGHGQILIRNGIISGFHSGIQASGANATVQHVEDVVVRDCRVDGILLKSGTGAIRRCRVEDCGQFGIRVANAEVEFCGILRCGFDGIHVQDGIARIRECMVSANGWNGVRSLPSTSVSCIDCLAIDNGQYGFRLTTGGVAERCLATRNKTGGFWAEHTRLAYSLARRNGPDGSGTAAGILVTDSCVVEDNYCVGNERGIVATGNRNLIQRNACSGNGTNWSVANNNTANVIVAAKSPASTEAPNGVPLGSSDPLVNYTF